jgi:N-acetylglucosaminyldiphosphoundecaprenol N-acetyl-beta-D-mannosaminyltransferase
MSSSELMEIIELPQSRAELLGVPIGPTSLEDMIVRSLQAIEGRVPPCTFACANPHSLVAASGDEEFRRALRASTFVVADGVGVAIVARVLGLDVGPRITGHDYFAGILQALAKRGHGRVFFFGSSPAVLQSISGKFRLDYPELTLCGTLSPPYHEFSVEENSRIVAEINAARPDLLWVGMTAPKQERWVCANMGALGVPVVASVGAVFEFYAGTRPRAPEWVCRRGLEWAYRLACEPRRLWRRTVISGPRFLAEVMRRHVLRTGRAT